MVIKKGIKYTIRRIILAGLLIGLFMGLNAIIPVVANYIHPVLAGLGFMGVVLYISKGV